MKERLYTYLRDRPSAVPAEHLVRDVLGIRGASAQLAEKLIATAVAGDDRFERTEAGWQAKGRQLGQTIFLAAHVGRKARQLALVVATGLRVAGSGLLDLSPSLAFPAVQWKGDSPVCIGGKGRLVELLEALQGGCVVQFRGASALRMLQSLSIRAGKGELECDALPLQGLARGVLGLQVTSPEELAAALQLPLRLHEGPIGRAELLGELLVLLLERCVEKGLATVDEVVEVAEPPVPPVAWANLRFGPEFLRSLPQTPGVYLMLSRLGEVLYVGKARNLRQRLRSYFQPSRAEEQKTVLLLRHLHDFRIQQVGSELEALLLEHQLIAEHDPPVNRQVAVHPRQVQARTRANRILVMPSAEAGAVELFFASRTGSLAQMRAGLTLDEKQARALLSRLYFSAQPEAPSETEQQRAEILFSWMEANQDHVSWIDVDAAKDLEDCLRLIRLHVLGFEPGRRQIYR